MEPLALSTAQQFESERFGRAIDATDDVPTLRGLAKQLLHAWLTQRAATAWTMRQGLKPIEIPPLPAPAGADVAPWDDPLA
jgi:hypothetical protein